jgi:hypothetical protein
MLFAKYNYNDQVKDANMGGTCTMYRGEEEYCDEPLPPMDGFLLMSYPW